jgi:D-arabinose 1-dehydrogenase-like Zn-dependent alcohol dehydrogenase
MLVKLLQTTGNGKFEEVEWNKPDINSSEIEVKALMTGVCRSDIDMMHGNFGPLPIHMQGHEGLGQVTKVGKDINDVSIGDFVATRGEPAYADYYNVRTQEYVKVPTAEPKYIVEPVACGLNIVMSIIDKLNILKDPRILIIGSGFLATVVYKKLHSLDTNYQINVIGSSNRKFWEDRLMDKPDGKYDIVIDLKDDSTLVFDQDILNENATVVLAAEKKGITTTFSNLLWKNASMVFPSPRSPNFHFCMTDAVNMIFNGILNVNSFWTKSYSREIDWKNAFKDGSERPIGYSRGYITWEKHMFKIYEEQRAQAIVKQQEGNT